MSNTLRLKIRRLSSFVLFKYFTLWILLLGFFEFYMQGWRYQATTMEEPSIHGTKVLSTR